MVFLDFVLVGLLLGRLAGGRVGHLADQPIDGKRFAFAAIALQLAAFPSGVFPWGMPTGVARVLWMVSYALLVLVLVLNRRLPGVLLVAAGLLSNLVAIGSNGGLMPVREQALRAAGEQYHLHNNSIQLVHPHIAWLIDRWAVPHWLPFGNVYSIGDVLIAVGTCIAVAAAMRAGATAPTGAVADRPATGGLSPAGTHSA